MLKNVAEGEKTGKFAYLPASFLGKKARVVSVQTDDPVGVNAMGEKVDDSVLVNPACGLVVQFSEGTFAMTSGYLSVLLSPYGFLKPFRLLEDNDRRLASIQSQLPSVIGQTVYAAAFSRLYQPNASFQEMTSMEERLHRMTALEMPRAKPLVIEAAKYVNGNNEDAVVLKLKGPDGHEYLTFSRLSTLPGGKRSFLEALFESDSNLMTPDSLNELTKREIAAVQQGSLFVGMSKSALHWAMGFPDKENEWNRGGQQLIFAGGQLFVYVSNDRVTNWQVIDR